MEPLYRKVIIVEKCSNCPYLRQYMECGKTRMTIKEIGIIPDWCPLEFQPVEPQEPKEEIIFIPKWQMVSIEDVLRQANNIHHSQSKETCFDRCICKSWEFACKALGKEYGFEPDKERKESWRDFTMTDKTKCQHFNCIKENNYKKCIDCGAIINSYNTKNGIE